MNRATVGVLVGVSLLVATGSFVTITRVKAHRRAVLEGDWRVYNTCVMGGPLDPGEAPHDRLDRIRLAAWLEGADAAKLSCDPMPVVRAAAKAGALRFADAVRAFASGSRTNARAADAAWTEATALALPMDARDADRKPPRLAKLPLEPAALPLLDEERFAPTLRSAVNSSFGRVPPPPVPVPRGGATLESAKMVVVGGSWDEPAPQPEWPLGIRSRSADGKLGPLQDLGSGHVTRRCESSDTAAVIVRTRHHTALFGLFSTGRALQLWSRTDGRFQMTPARQTEFFYRLFHNDETEDSVTLSCSNGVVRFAKFAPSSRNAIGVNLATCDTSGCRSSTETVTMPQRLDNAEPAVVLFGDELAIAWNEPEVGIVIHQRKVDRHAEGTTTIALRDDPALPRTLAELGGAWLVVLRDRPTFVFRARTGFRGVSLDRNGHVEALDFPGLGL